MKRLLVISVLSLLAFSCHRNSSQVWEDVKTAGRCANRGFDSLLGKEYNSELISKRGDFIGPQDADFIPLSDNDLRTQYRVTDLAVPQPKYSPGQPGSGIPGVDQFQTPEGSLADLFANFHFATDDHILRDREDFVQLKKISEYLKSHSNVYLYIEGHCDERASAAYNMALGTRRANFVRVELIKQGVDFNRLYTISYGKEKPFSLGHTSQDWQENRRVAFRLFEKP